MLTSVLLVDDDVAFRDLARRMLGEMGLAVVGEAGTVAAAAAAAAELRPDAALVDIGLPDGDGFALTRQLAALPWTVRIVLTSSDPDAATPDSVRSAGAVGFVAKDELPSGWVRELLIGD